MKIDSGFLVPLCKFTVSKGPAIPVHNILSDCIEVRRCMRNLQRQQENQVSITASEYFRTILNP